MGGAGEEDQGRKLSTTKPHNYRTDIAFVHFGSVAVSVPTRPVFLTNSTND